MHTPDTQEMMDYLKVEDPKEWCMTTASFLESAVMEYNKMARSWNRNNKDDQLGIIVAFMMTEEEEEEFLNGLEITEDDQTDDQA